MITFTLILCTQLSNFGMYMKVTYALGFILIFKTVKNTLILLKWIWNIFFTLFAFEFYNIFEWQSFSNTYDWYQTIVWYEIEKILVNLFEIVQDTYVGVISFMITIESNEPTKFGRLLKKSEIYNRY